MNPKEIKGHQESFDLWSRLNNKLKYNVNSKLSCKYVEHEI